MKSNDQQPKQPVGQRMIRRKRLFKWLGRVAVAGVVIAAVAVGYVYFCAKQAVDKTYDHQNAVTVKQGEFNGKRPFAVLLLGTDTGALDRTDKLGNTDTMILALVNPKRKRYSLVSIPRDTMVKIYGSKDHDQPVAKINAAYSLGGAQSSLQTVSRLLNVPIKYYALVNMGGIMKMIRYVGGLEIRPTLSFSYGGYRFKKGKLTRMGGDGALAYSRMRYTDPLGDYGRQERQRQVITTLIEKTVSLNSLTNLDKIMTSVSGNVKTNLPFTALQGIAVNYRSAVATSHSDYLHGYSCEIDGSSYQVQPTAELQRITNYVRSELGPAAAKISNHETYQNQRNEAHGFDFKATRTQTYQIYPGYTESSQP
ncbi:MAG: LCP family protein [Lactobacillus sp.]|nr:LCP family protein [Lactobacillus sp.]MDN6042961.1 LCP family protein [Lactobacillus sp.]MDN6052964.1 LCP family protein [Lactobacillus sp.]